MKVGLMIRGLSLTAMAGSFLMISPNLRNTVLDGYAQAGLTMDAHSPYSYIGLGVAVLGALMVFFHRSSQPR
jgi:hypothetical protein